MFQAIFSLFAPILKPLFTYVALPAMLFGAFVMMVIMLLVN